ncbi:hypothetical protein STEG23_015979, partial [Scotinomys teguina]
MCRLSWFLDPRGWSKTTAVGLYIIFPGICTLSLPTERPCLHKQKVAPKQTPAAKPDDLNPIPRPLCVSRDTQVPDINLEAFILQGPDVVSSGPDAPEPKVAGAGEWEKSSHCKGVLLSFSHPIPLPLPSPAVALATLSIVIGG